MEPAEEGTAVMKPWGNAAQSIMGNPLITFLNERKALSGMYLSFL